MIISLIGFNSEPAYAMEPSGHFSKIKEGIPFLLIGALITASIFMGKKYWSSVSTQDVQTQTEQSILNNEQERAAEDLTPSLANNLRQNIPISAPIIRHNNPDLIAPAALTPNTRGRAGFMDEFRIANTTSNTISRLTFLDEFVTANNVSNDENKSVSTFRDTNP